MRIPRRYAAAALSATFAFVGLFTLVRTWSMLVGMRHDIPILQQRHQQHSSSHSSSSNRHHSSATTSRNAMSTTSEDMNIVVFYADDWTVNTLGIFNDKVQTPNLNAMAKRGMAFTHNCVTTSICWQSRATMVTGLYKAVHNQSRIWEDYMFDKTVKWRDTLYPQLFAAGYHVGYIGKWHAPMPPEHQPFTFDHFNAYAGSHWRTRDGKMRHITDLNGEDAIAYLRNHVQNRGPTRAQNDDHRVSSTDDTKKNETTTSTRPHQKFALTVAFFATHAQDYAEWPRGFEPDNFTEALYKNTSGTYFRPPTASQEGWDNMPWFFDTSNEGRHRWRLRYDTEEHRQESVERVYRMATEVDKVVGDVIDEVKKMGQYDNTLFMFTTDNGVFHGEHGLSDKWYPHDESIRVPLIIQDPRMPKNLQGTTSDEFTLNLDLAPTLLSAANVPVPSHMQGRDIADLYLGDYNSHRKNWRKDFFYEWSQGRPEDAAGHLNEDSIPAVFALVRKDYKYFYWPLKKYEQLFHIASDPFEERDVINSTDPSVVQGLRDRYEHLKRLSQSGQRV